MRQPDPQHWENFKVRLKLRWKQLTDEDIEACRDNFNTLSDRVQACCGESREVAQNFIDNLWFEIYVRGAKQTYKKRSLKNSFGS